MYELYCNICYHGTWKLELCDRYDNLAHAINQTIAMWPENDRPVPMFMSKGSEIIATFTPFGPKGENVWVKVMSEVGTGNMYTDFVYEHVGSMIGITKCKKDGVEVRFDHNDDYTCK